jgi:hypothetical protein
MSQKKIITVFGATGAQGGGLVRAILHDKHSEFAVRAVTVIPIQNMQQSCSNGCRDRCC